MSLELIYTSAPKGLKPGSRGFCTVAMTQGMPPQLADRLESLSGYRQVFAPQDAQSRINPVVHSHLRLSIAGRNYHVLSRICAAGLDYSQRANKFAYHLVLDASELPPAGPAWTIAQPGLMDTAWNDAPKLLPPRKRASSGNVAGAICRGWQQIVGDAGWGGVLAEAAIERPKIPVTIIFRPGLDPLPLIAESLALLPPELRWNVTFSTYYTKLPPGVECNWRCALQGSPESKGTPGLVIDLCRPLGAAQGGAYVTAARTGTPPAVATPAKRPIAAVVASRPGDDRDLEQLLTLSDDSDSPTNRPTASRAADIPPSVEPLPPLPPQSPPPPIAGAMPVTRRKPRLKQRAKWPFIAVAAAIAFIAACVVVVVCWPPINKADSQGGQSVAAITPNKAGSNQTSDPKGPNASPKDPGPSKNEAAPSRPVRAADGISEAPGGPHSSQSNSTPTLKPEVQSPSSATQPAISEKQPTDSGKSPTGAVANTSTSAAKIEPTARKAENAAAEDPRQQWLRTVITSLPQFKQIPQQHVALGAELPSWSVPLALKSNMQCDLDLLGGEHLPHEYQLKLKPSGDPKLQEWEVVLESKKSALVTNSVGTLQLKNDKLVFTWKPGANPPDESLQLANCLLGVKVSLPDHGKPERGFVAFREPFGDRVPIQCDELIDKLQVTHIVDSSPVPTTSPSAELFLLGDFGAVHSIKRVDESRYTIDGRICFSLKPDWRKVEIHYDGIPVTWEIARDPRSPLRDVICGDPNAPSPITPTNLAAFMTFLTTMESEITIDKTTKQTAKDNENDPKLKRQFVDDIKKLDQKLTALDRERRDANAKAGMLREIAKPEVRFGYRLFFAISVDRKKDGKKIAVEWAKTIADPTPKLESAGDPIVSQSRH